jgi:hypothetical protein
MTARSSDHNGRPVQPNRSPSESLARRNQRDAARLDVRAGVLVERAEKRIFPGLGFELWFSVVVEFVYNCNTSEHTARPRPEVSPTQQHAQPFREVIVNCLCYFASLGKTCSVHCTVSLAGA